MLSRNHAPMRIGPTSDSDVTRGESLGWSIAGSVALLVVAFVVGQVGAVSVAFSCWDDLGRLNGCNTRGLIIGWALIAVAAIIVIAAVVLPIRTLIRSRRSRDGSPANTAEDDR